MGDGALVAGKLGDIFRFAHLLDHEDPRPRAIVYASSSDPVDERLLIVPASERFDYRDVYQSVDVSDLKVVPETDPYIHALAAYPTTTDHAPISLDRSVVSGVYVERAIIFRMSL